MFTAMCMLHAPELGLRGRVMKSVRVIGWMVTVSALSAVPLVSAQNPDLSSDVKYWQDLASIEKAKNDVAASEAKLREAIATSKKAELEARFPPGTTQPLKGSVTGAENKMGLASNILAVELAKKLAKDVCANLATIDKDPTKRNVVLYNANVFASMSSSRLLLEQLDWLERDLAEASAAARKRESSTPAPVRPSGSTPRRGPFFAAGPALIALTGSIRAFADLTSLAKTDVSLSPGEFEAGDAQALFVTALQQNCAERFVVLDGYLGDIPPGVVDTARKRIGILHTNREIVVEFRDRLKADLPKLAAEKRSEAQLQIDELTTLTTQAEGFLSALKPFDSSETSPLMNALKLEALNKRIAGHNVMELKFLLEGLSVTRDNMFTGQKLYLSATSVFWYRVMNRQGEVLLTDVQRRVVTPMFFDVKGKNPKDEFFTPLETVHGMSPSD